MRFALHGIRSSPPLVSSASVPSAAAPQHRDVTAIAPPTTLDMGGGANTVCLFSRPYLDPCSQCYVNVLSVNALPQGPLARLVHRLRFSPLSPFQATCTNQPLRAQCALVLRGLNGVGGCGNGSGVGDCGGYDSYDSYYAGGVGSTGGCCGKFGSYMTVDGVMDLTSWLLSQGYIVRSDLARMFMDSPMNVVPHDGGQLLAVVTYAPGAMTSPSYVINM